MRARWSARQILIMDTMRPMSASVPHVTVVGHVTCDLFDSAAGPQIRLGGAGSFAARAAAHLGLRTGLVTAAPLDAPLLRVLTDVPNLQVACAPSPAMTTRLRSTRASWSAEL